MTRMKILTHTVTNKDVTVMPHARFLLVTAN